MSDVSIHWECIREDGLPPRYEMRATRDPDVPQFHRKGQFIRMPYTIRQQQAHPSRLTYWEACDEHGKISGRGSLHLAMTDCEQAYLKHLRRALERMGEPVEFSIPEVHRQGDLMESREVTA